MKPEELISKAPVLSVLEHKGVKYLKLSEVQKLVDFEEQIFFLGYTGDPKTWMERKALGLIEKMGFYPQVLEGVGKIKSQVVEVHRDVWKEIMEEKENGDDK